uniref:Methyltransferase domain-containing protein n=1 Tax=Mucochytrium quahogii TaxID=96639 RepID=A0A7S2WHT3_9STRA|mmetsp:Transcript_18158/g.29474  ORF Transcript_18158/g.29474 Transcript_18158/m.29474 type:complete len:385 (-) Transcript_18158:127-1281(-)|eukprot:CAMPEP_0203747654 /NCGR_PEP_ID=MMETSP0098-20131031/2741_1 /ASSEMBLY_ACC=CAM_ASM_000208 /TAXON_ID=96639 /ORGANISM=" , Strain NY0313808BC1" /LENGTH=384 /DNA_ID=CAMNT_0050636143 /DNA_START=258 /DNA_END=1412 /DNA_ORIENTATION=-
MSGSTMTLIATVLGVYHAYTVLGASTLGKVVPVIGVYLLYRMGAFQLSLYRLKTAASGVKRLLSMPEKDKLQCIAAYEFFQKMQAGEKTKTEDETMHVRNYYNVLNEIMSIADIEKMYIPPQLNEWEGLYANQLLCEQGVLKELNLKRPEKSHLLDMGCGRGRISHYFSEMTGGKVSGYNIDPNQIQNAKDYAIETNTTDKLDFKVGDHHNPLEYPDETFDGCFSFQAVWPFFKKEELDSHAKEMYRVLKPGARYACSEYLLTPHFDWNNEEHVNLHKLFLPTLAATQSMYPADVCAALERAGFKIILSAPSKSEAWPLCEQKRDLIYAFRRVVHFFTAIYLCPSWLAPLLDNLQMGGQAWTDAEKMKIADLNWRIVCQKPIKN